MIQILSTTTKKGTVFYDIYLSILVGLSSCPTSSLTDKANANNHEIEELGMVYLDKINIYLTTSEISSNPSKIGQGLIQWDLVPLCILLYTTPRKGTVLCDVYVSMIFNLSSCPTSYSTDKANSNNNEVEELMMMTLYPINHHDLPQNCGGSKYLCPFWICPTANLITHSRKSFIINDL